MSFSAYKKKKPYYVLLPNENVMHYVCRLIRNIIRMYPRAREYGFRYYTNTDFRRKISYKIKRRHKENVRRQRGGSFHKPHYKKKLKLMLLERDNQFCNLCKESFCVSDLTIDHVLPLFLGGDSNINISNFSANYAIE